MTIDLAVVYDKIKQQNIDYTTEESLFMLNVEFSHLLSLLWSKTKRTTTDSYRMFLLSECAKYLIYATLASNVDIAVVVKEVNDAYGEFKKEIKSVNIDEVITSFIPEIPMQFGSTDRFALACWLCELVTGCNWSQIIDSQKFE